MIIPQMPKPTDHGHDQQQRTQTLDLPHVGNGENGGKKWKKENGQFSFFRDVQLCAPWVTTPSLHHQHVCRKVVRKYKARKRHSVVAEISEGVVSQEPNQILLGICPARQGSVLRLRHFSESCEHARAI
jgi:hypothetical protein